MHSAFLYFVLALSALVTARTDLSGCTSSEVVTFGGASYIYYIPDTGEICSFLDCGGGRAPPKTTVPGCPLYRGTATVTPDYLPGFGKNGPASTATAATVTSTSAQQAGTTTDAGSAMTPVITTATTTSPGDPAAATTSAMTTTSSASATSARSTMITSSISSSTLTTASNSSTTTSGSSASASTTKATSNGATRYTFQGILWGGAFSGAAVLFSALL